MGFEKGLLIPCPRVKRNFFTFLIDFCLQSLVEDARKHSKQHGSEDTKPDIKQDASLNSIENGFGSKDNQQLVVRYLMESSRMCIFICLCFRGQMVGLPGVAAASPLSEELTP